MPDFFADKKIAIICDWIKDWGGMEVVLTHFLEMFPQADIYTSIFYQEGNPIFAGRKITTSFIQNIPFLNKRPKMCTFLRPYAFEQFDLSAYDIILSSSTAESKGVVTKPESLHVCYCHTPTRYFWSHVVEYQNRLEFGILNPLARLVMPAIIHSARLWDFYAAKRVDAFVANSYTTKRRIEKYYRQDATVIYPGTDMSRFVLQEEKEEYYLYVGRMIPYKRFDLVVDAFNENGKRLILATATENKLLHELRAKSKPNIEWKIGASNEEIRELFSHAKAFLFPPEEDFGIVPVEAMACGTPVIAYRKWGATETVVESENINESSGIFFLEQSAFSLNVAIARFESLRFNPAAIRMQAEKFSVENFKTQIYTFIEKRYKEKVEK